MASTVFYDNANEIALLSASFADANGNPADPTSVTCVVTEPAGIEVIHTFAGTAPADIVKVMTGKYTLAVPCSPSVTGVDGLWGFEWIGSGVVSDVQPGTWRVMPEDVSQVWYVGLEEMQERLGINGDDSENSMLTTAIASATGFINEYCGRHFNRVSQVRTYQPTNVWSLDIDDLVTVTKIAVDQDGDGTFEQTWVQGIDFQLRYGPQRYNAAITGIPRPYRQLTVIQSGKWLPFTWPYSHMDRVQIDAVWGWPAVPWPVTEACRILTADLYKTKDAPFGVAGVSDLGVVRVGSNPWLVELLQPYVNGRIKVGV